MQPDDGAAEGRRDNDFRPMKLALEILMLDISTHIIKLVKLIVSDRQHMQIREVVHILQFADSVTV